MNTKQPKAMAVQPKQEPVAWMHRSNYMHFMKEKPLGEIGFLFVPLYTHPQPQPQKRPQNCGTGFCSCIECPYPDHFPDAGKMIEPFGYFRSTLGGWEDCAETDEGARPLYEAPQPDHFADAGKPMGREWVGLTDEERLQFLNEILHYGTGFVGPLDFLIRAIETKLCEKNKVPQPKPEWMGLTRVEKMEIIISMTGEDWVYALDAAEAKLREKNTSPQPHLKAMQQALDCLEDIFGKNKVDVVAINALREVLGEVK